MVPKKCLCHQCNVAFCLLRSSSVNFDHLCLFCTASPCPLRAIKSGRTHWVDSRHAPGDRRRLLLLFWCCHQSSGSWWWSCSRARRRRLEWATLASRSRWWTANCWRCLETRPATQRLHSSAAAATAAATRHFTTTISTSADSSSSNFTVDNYVVSVNETDAVWLRHDKTQDMKDKLNYKVSRQTM